MFICYFLSVLFFVVGLAFFTGKAPNYINGYSTLSEREKSYIQILPLCRNISIAFFSASICFMVAGYSEFFRTTLFKWCIIIWFILCGLDLLYIEKSGRYQK